ncbi:hypothetical protein MKW92_026290, partial [Papaver armeniacum]
VMLQQLSKVSPFYLFREASITRVRDDEVECTRSSVHETNCCLKNLQPEIYEVMVEERDKFMFTNLRSLQGKIVAVVGMGHMDGIELFCHSITLFWQCMGKLWPWLNVFPPSSTTQDDTSHYQHGIPGIPTDGKVVLLNNSNNGNLSCWNCSYSEREVSTCIKIVIVEQCKRCAERTVNWKPEDDILYNLFCRSMRAPGGLCMKFGVFFLNYRYSLLHAHGIFPSLEFKVAMEESSTVGATCFYIDQDIAVMLQHLSKVSPFYLFREAYNTRVRDEVECTRSSSMVMIEEDRDKFMFTNLRSFQGKVVAVVGMGQMDGIELLWKLAEEDDNSKSSTSLVSFSCIVSLIL